MDLRPFTMGFSCTFQTQLIWKMESFVTIIQRTQSTPFRIPCQLDNFSFTTTNGSLKLNILRVFLIRLLQTCVKCRFLVCLLKVFIPWTVFLLYILFNTRLPDNLWVFKVALVQLQMSRNAQNHVPQTVKNVILAQGYVLNEKPGFDGVDCDISEYQLFFYYFIKDKFHILSVNHLLTSVYKD